MLSFTRAAVAVAAAIAVVKAETHTVHFTNKYVAVPNVTDVR